MIQYYCKRLQTEREMVRVRSFHRPKTRFMELRSLVIECLRGYTKINKDKVKERIRESYVLQDIDHEQCDWLMKQLG